MNFQIKEIVDMANSVGDDFTKQIVQLTARHCVRLAFLNPKLDSIQLSNVISKEFDLPLDNYDHSEYYFDITRNR